jgi:hypothetical protein
MASAVIEAVQSDGGEGLPHAVQEQAPLDVEMQAVKTEEQPEMVSAIATDVPADHAGKDSVLAASELQNGHTSADPPANEVKEEGGILFQNSLGGMHFH